MKDFNPKKINKINIALIGIGALIGVIGALSEFFVLAFFGMAVIVGSAVFRLIFYRCPYCSKYLDRSSGDYCPYCGKKIN